MKNSRVKQRNTQAQAIPLRRSLYARLGFAFFLILIFVGAVQLYISGNVYRPLAGHIEQQVSWNLASELASRLTPALKDGFDKEQVEALLLEYAFMNPKIESYIIDAEGRIIAEVAPYGGRRIVDRVPLEPVKRALESSSPFWPIFGRDPRAPENASNGVTRTISVAEIEVQGEAVYVYLILEAGVFRYLSRATGQIYIAATVIIGLLAAIILAGAAGVVTFLYLSKQFRHLTESVSRYREGDRSVRVTVQSEDEIGTLGEAINEMMDTISEQTEALRENDRLRRELIASISHDLRSPLTTMQGFLETLHRKGDHTTKEEQQRYLGLIAESVRLQRQLVDDLFELSKLEAKERKPEMECIHPGEIAQDVCIKHKPLAEEKQIELRLQVAPDTPFVNADIVLLDRALSNLVGNAIRYTQRGGDICIEVRPCAEGSSICVRDNGPGIPEDELPFIFDSFYRVHKDRNRKSGGSGLGLAIVQRIVELHESSISVHSELGAGTSFSFSLAAASPVEEHYEQQPAEAAP